MKKDLNWWCDRAWIKFGCWITALMTALILIFWQSWSAELKVIAAIAALVPIHVVEEWVFPGGFHFQYNTFLYRSDLPDRYPMCRKSDMITNLEATFLYMVLTCIGVANGGEASTGMMMGTIGFCLLEVLIHTFFGTMAYFRFKGKGKTTIYGPGSITAYLGFGVFGVILCYGMQGRTIGTNDWIVCAVILAIILVCCILIPENVIKKKDNEYIFKTNVSSKTVTFSTMLPQRLSVNSSLASSRAAIRASIRRPQLCRFWISVSTAFTSASTRSYSPASSASCFLYSS